MIKDSYSVPHYAEFDWGQVDWASPLPNDLVALADKTQSARRDYFKAVREIFAAGGTADDLPSLTRWTWDYVVVPVGIFSGEYSSEAYDRFGQLLFAGEYVREDRMLAQMTDAEMNEHFQMQESVKVIIQEIDFDSKIDEISVKNAEKEQQISMLREMFGDEN